MHTIFTQTHIHCTTVDLLKYLINKIDNAGKSSYTPKTHATVDLLEYLIKLVSQASSHFKNDVADRAKFVAAAGKKRMFFCKCKLLGLLFLCVYVFVSSH
jgi:hypothetical protein